MNKKQKGIVLKMRNLLDELEKASGIKQSDHKKTRLKQSVSIARKGVMGAILTLVEEGFFNKPQTKSKIMEKLKEIGHYDKPETVSMNLLNLTKKRKKLNRFKHKKYKNQWEYVIRR